MQCCVCFWLSVLVQLIAWKDSSPNDLLCVEWDVKPYTFTHSLIWKGRNIPAYQISARYLNHGWDITTSGLGKQTSAILEFYFQFQYLRLRYHRHAIYYLSTKFCPNRTMCDRVMTSYSFFKMAAVSHIELFQFYCRPPTKCKWGPRSVLKFRLDRIYNFRDNAIFVLWCFGLNLPIYKVVSAAHAKNESDFPVLWYLNIGSMLFRFIAKHASRVTDRHMDGQTDRITTAKTALPLLRHVVNKNRSTWTLRLIDPGTGGPRDSGQVGRHSTELRKNAY